MKKNLFLKIFLAIFIILTICVIDKKVKAQLTTQITISPPKQEINVKPGSKTRFQVKFFNASAEPISGFIKTADFIVTDKTGGPDLIFVPPENNRYSASTWLTPLENRVTLAPNTPFTTTVLVNVPNNISGCGHYAAVYFQPAPAGISENKKATSQISFRLTSLISFLVEGQKCTEKAYLNKITAPTFLEYGPIPVVLEVLNRSDYHIQPQGYVSLKDIFNKQAAVAPIPSYNIFPEAIREYKIELGSKWLIGRYQVDFTAGYGKTGQTIKGFTYIWVFPWRITLVIILTIIIIVLLLNYLYRQILNKETTLEKELEKERKELEELKKQLKNKHE